jgi:flagellar biogenesis protein FliO
VRKKKLFLLGFPALCLVVIFATWGSIQGGAPVPAEGAGADEGNFGSGRSGMSGTATRIGLSLALILVLILGAAWSFRVFGGRMGGPKAGKVRVLDRCFLAPKRALYTVRMGERVVVIGVTESAITPVLEFSEEEGDRLYPKVPAEPIEDSASFSSVLKGIQSKWAKARGQA